MQHSVRAIHSLAEFYATLSALPDKPILRPEQVLLFTEEISLGVPSLVLDSEEYLRTLKQTAERGLSSGTICNAVLACAAKSDAQVIYTWNLKHFRTVAPHLADRMQHP
jgi:hypothetical protein